MLTRSSVQSTSRPNAVCDVAVAEEIGEVRVNGLTADSPGDEVHLHDDQGPVDALYPRMYYDHAGLIGRIHAET